jgi:hypothetical protein
MKPRRFVRVTPSRSFNTGWRLGVVICAALVLMGVAWSLLVLLEKVWRELF